MHEFRLSHFLIEAGRYVLIGLHKEDDAQRILLQLIFISTECKYFGHAYTKNMYIQSPMVW